MAKLGGILSYPEKGWRRFLNTNKYISYTNFTIGIDGKFSSGKNYYTKTLNGSVKFNFTGTKIRIIGILHTEEYTNQNYASEVFIDGFSYGEVYNVSNGVLTYKVLNFEVFGLDYGDHTFELINNKGAFYLWLDSIDVGEDDSISYFDTDKKLSPLRESFLNINFKNLKMGDKLGAFYKYSGSSLGSYVSISESEGEEFEVSNPINLITKFNLWNSSDSTKITISSSITVSPNSEHFIISDSINISDFKTLKQFTLTMSNISAKYMLATDDDNWFVLDKGTNLFSLLDTGLDNLEAIKSYAGDLSEIINISTEQFSQFLRNKKFKILLYISNISSSVGTISGLSASFLEYQNFTLKHFNFIFCGFSNKGFYKFIANDNLQKNITWETLSSAGLCTMSGKDLSYNDIFAPIITTRLVHSLSSLGDGDEWGTLISGDLEALNGSNSTFWNSKVASWTVTTSVTNASYRVLRGGSDIGSLSSAISTSTGGFRPVLLVSLDNPEASFIPQPDLDEVFKLKFIKPGKMISCDYEVTVEGEVGVFKNLGSSTSLGISDNPGSLPSGKFYFVCVGYTPSGKLKLVADRVLQTSISWETLKGFCTFSGVSAEGFTGIGDSLIRLPQSAKINLSSDASSSEWDNIILRDSIGSSGIAGGDKIFNFMRTKSWCMDTAGVTDDVGSAFDSTYRVARGGEDGSGAIITKSIFPSTSVYGSIGFRPILIADVIDAAVQPFMKITPTRVLNIAPKCVILFEKGYDSVNLVDSWIKASLNEIEVLAKINLVDWEYEFNVPLKYFVEGSNTLRITYTFSSITETKDYFIFKEVLGDTVRLRTFYDYDGGYNYSNVTTTEDVSKITIDYDYVKESPVQQDGIYSIKLPPEGVNFIVKA